MDTILSDEEAAGLTETHCPARSGHVTVLPLPAWNWSERGPCASCGSSRAQRTLLGPLPRPVRLGPGLPGLAGFLAEPSARTGGTSCSGPCPARWQPCPHQLCGPHQRCGHGREGPCSGCSAHRPALLRACWSCCVSLALRSQKPPGRPSESGTQSGCGGLLPRVPVVLVRDGCGCPRAGGSPGSRWTSSWGACADQEPGAWGGGSGDEPLRSGREVSG